MHHDTVKFIAMHSHVIGIKYPIPMASDAMHLYRIFAWKSSNAIYVFFS